MEIARQDPEHESSTFGQAYDQLRVRRDREAFEEVSSLLLAKDASQRQLAALILGELGTEATEVDEVTEVVVSLDSQDPRRPRRTGGREGGDDEQLAGEEESEPDWVDEIPPLLWPLLDDASPAVVATAIRALGHFDIDHELARLEEPARSRHEGVRLAVAQAVAGAEEGIGLQLLVALSDDAAREVRNWATFALAQLCEADTSEIRRALTQRLGDDDDEVRDEAVLGLALRHDPDVSDYIEALLLEEEVSALVVQAAAALADPQLLPALRELETWWDPADPALDEAIAACRESSLRSRAAGDPDSGN